MLDFYDGSHHFHKVKKIRSIISVSSQLLRKRTFHHIGSTSGITNILALMQKLCGESLVNLFSIVEKVYIQEYEIYMLNDGELIVMICTMVK